MILKIKRDIKYKSNRTCYSILSESKNSNDVAVTQEMCVQKYCLFLPSISKPKVSFQTLSYLISNKNVIILLHR